VQVNLEEWKAGKPLRVTVQQHEGRARAWVVDDLNGNVPTLVHVITWGGIRANDLNKKFFEDLRKVGFVRQGDSKFAAPTPTAMGRIFWNGETL